MTYCWFCGVDVDSCLMMEEGEVVEAADNNCLNMREVAAEGQAASNRADLDIQGSCKDESELLTCRNRC
jgi:hypothetical protein